MFGNHNFVSFQYLEGISNDLGIKKLQLEICNDGLNILYSKSSEIEFLPYEYISNVYTFEEEDTDFSLKKGITFGIIGSLIGGADLAALACGFLGWQKTKNYVLEIEIFSEEQGDTGSLYVTAKKDKVLKFADALRCAINNFKN